jgi:hypothetical protein
MNFINLSFEITEKLLFEKSLGFGSGKKKMTFGGIRHLILVIS